MARDNDNNNSVQAKVHFPYCVNETFNRQHFHYSSGGGLQVDIGHQLLDVLTASVDEFNETIVFCYPLSQQLKQCRLSRYLPGSYQIISHSMVHDNVTVQLGDYYVDDDDYALTCTTPIHTNRTVPRCNYISLHPGEYHVLKDGHIDIVRTDNLDDMAVSLPYTIDENFTATVCYPLDVEFLNCGVKVMLSPDAYDLTPDFRLFYKKHELYLNADNYFPYDDKAVVCAVESVLTAIQLMSTIYSGFDVLSLLCLIATLVNQAMVRNLDRHSKCRLSHIACMVILYCAIAYRKFMDSIGSVSCYAVFLVIYLSSMAAFFWMTVLAFDVWQSLAGLQRLTSKSCSFFYYSVLGWGLPAFLLCIAVTVDSHDDVMPDSLDLYPRVGHLCWFKKSRSTWLFYHGPMIFLTVLNVALFAMTLANLHIAHQGSVVVHRRLNRQLLIILVKLFAVMLLCWMTEVTCWSLSAADNFYCWSASDAITSLQGLAIFVIYTCNRQNLDYVRSWLHARCNGRWKNLTLSLSGTTLT